MTREEKVREIREAKEAGNRSLSSLCQAQKVLNSAGNWGLVDLFGGGFITDMIKHSKLSEANKLMEQAKYEVQRFQKELNDVQMQQGSFGVNISDFLVFADFFFDGLIADWMVQSKIGEAKRQVNEAIGKINQILKDLEQMERQIGGC